MPELPEVETVVRGLDSSMRGRRIIRAEVFRPNLRVPFPPDFCERIAGQAVNKVARRAKYFMVYLEDGTVVIGHLGMSGRMIVRPQDAYPLARHDHVRWQMDDGKEVVFNDARRFGLMLLADADTLEQHDLLVHLGPEPLSNHFSEDYLATELLKKKSAIKPVLMDQRLVVGVGNIYASEALFRCGIHPGQPAHLCAEQAGTLVAAIRAVLEAAIASGGSTLRDYARESGEMGYFQHQFQVYGREGKPCYACATPVARITQTGRSTFFCPSCQASITRRSRKRAACG